MGFVVVIYEIISYKFAVTINFNTKLPKKKVVFLCIDLVA